jgi:hypothetical protein
MRGKVVLPDLPNVPAYFKVPESPYQDLLSKSAQIVRGRFFSTLKVCSDSRRGFSSDNSGSRCNFFVDLPTANATERFIIGNIDPILSAFWHSFWRDVE